MSALFVAPPESLYEALFPGRKPRIIAAVGGGGKTTLLKTLAAELSARGAKAVITTTTKMHPPEDRSLLARTPEDAALLLAAHPVVWLGVLTGEEKMTGIPAALPALLPAADYVLIEADGSRKKPLKMTDPRYEPVIPPEAEAVVALAGLDGLGKPISEAVHRPELARALLGAEASVVTPAIAARLLCHCYEPDIILLNKADTPDLQALGLEIAALLPERRTVITSLRDWGLAEPR